MKDGCKINPEKYKDFFSGYKYSISFLGDPSEDDSLRILCKLLRIFKNKLHIFSEKKLFLKSLEKIEKENFLDEDQLTVYLKCYKNELKTEKELAQVCLSSKINLFINPKKISSVNFKVFEILVSGGFLITNENQNLEKFFNTSKHLETYKNIDDLIDKIHFYLKNLNISKKIAQLGQFEVIRQSIISNKKNH